MGSGRKTERRSRSPSLIPFDARPRFPLIIPVQSSQCLHYYHLVGVRQIATYIVGMQSVCVIAIGWLFPVHARMGHTWTDGKTRPFTELHY